jgi:hypothetical protein
LHAILNGSQPDTWSNPAAWASGSVPASSSRLDIQLNTSSTDDLGTSQNPFVANDVIGATTGMTYPGLFTTGFLHANTIKDLGDLQIPSASGVTVRHDLVNVTDVEIHDGGVLDVGRNLVNVQDVAISFGSTMEVGDSIGKTSFAFGIGGGTLILDHPAGRALGNSLSLGLGQPGVDVNIELGHVAFDAADFIASVPGSLTGKVDLTEHGRLVYQLTNVKELAPAGVFTVGVDKANGYDFVSYHG